MKLSFQKLLYNNTFKCYIKALQKETLNYLFKNTNNM